MVPVPAWLATKLTLLALSTLGTVLLLLLSRRWAGGRGEATMLLTRRSAGRWCVLAGLGSESSARVRCRW